MTGSNCFDEITIVAATHYTTKCVENSHLSPPSCKLIRKTFESLFNRTHLSEDNEILVVYSSPEEYKREHDRYEDNLREFTQEIDSQLIDSAGISSRVARSIALEKVDTNYILYLEHDWEFLKSIDIPKLIEVMEKRSSINHVRFNKRKNIQSGRDTLLKPIPDAEVNLVKTSCFSNNPHIARTKRYRDWLRISRPDLNWITMMIDDPGRTVSTLHQLGSIHIKQNQLSDNMENMLDRYLKYNIDKYGFQQGHQKFGTCLYGELGGGPFIKHLGV